jgi:hypothetical protein
MMKQILFFVASSSVLIFDLDIVAVLLLPLLLVLCFFAE